MLKILPWLILELLLEFCHQKLMLKVKSKQLVATLMAGFIAIVPIACGGGGGSNDSVLRQLIKLQKVVFHHLSRLMFRIVR